jgi:tetratricopeptide (TPR) repeat protein
MGVATLPPAHAAGAAPAAPSSPTPVPAAASAAEEEARGRIAALEREARALGNDPAAALLFHEAGLLWEEPLRNPRNAAVAFQAAYKLAPAFVTNIRAARRLFSDVGNWNMVLQLLDAELLSTQEARARAALLLEKATVLEERLSRDADALAAYRQCLELQPSDVATLTQLESVYAARGDAGSLVQVKRLLAAALTEPALKAHYLTAAGLLLEDRLKSPGEAAAAFREAFTHDKTDLLLLGAVKRVAEREGRPEELVAALQAEAEVLGAQGVPAYLQLAKVLGREGRGEEALGALLAARRVAPAEPLVLHELAGIYERERRHEDLADVLNAWAANIHDESELVAVNLRLAALYEEDLKRDDAAVGPYQAILSRVPGHQAALAGLGKLHFRTQNWDGLVNVYEAEIAAADDVRTKAARVYKAAEVLEERLGRQDEAISLYNECLQLQPGYLPAQKALTRLYERQGRYADLVSMWEQDLLQTGDRDQVITTLNKMAVLYEDRLSDVPHAVECMRRVLEIAPDHLPAMQNLARLLEKAGRWRELLEAHELEASHVGDVKQVLSLHHRSAEILDEQLRDREGAIAAYERVLQLSPSYLPALRALGRLYAQDGRWAELVRMYRAEAEMSPSAEHAAALIHKIGELYEHRLKDEPSAVASYQEVLTLAPSHFPALRALARIYRAQSAWESLIEVLRAEAANRTDPAERANALYQAAATWEDALGRGDMAVEGYQEVLRLAPGHPAALHALARLHASRDDVKALVAVLDRQTQTAGSPAEKVAAYVKLARLYLDRTNEPARAAQCCEAVLGLEPGHLFALKTLERIRAGDRARRAELRLRLAERVGEPRLRHALRLSAVADQEGRSAGGSAGGGATLEELRRAFALDPEDDRVSFALERALRQGGDLAGLREAYSLRLSRLKEPTERVALLLRVAELSEGKLGDLPRARLAYAEALEAQPHLLPALQGARRVALKLGDLPTARRALEAEAQASRDPRGAIEAWVQAAGLARQSGDEEGAIGLYRKALERDPLDAAASEGLEGLLAGRGGVEDLAALHLRRGEARLAAKDASGAAAAFFAAAQTYLGIGNRMRAQVMAERALAVQPAHADALELRARIALEAEAWADAVPALQARVQLGGEPRALARLHLTLGALYQDRLADPTRAAAHLQTVLSLEPGSAEALERLASLHRAARNWTGAADCLRRLLDLAAPAADQARRLVALADVVEEGFGDAAQAASLYKGASELAPADMRVLDGLVRLSEKAGQVEALVKHLEAQAAAAPDRDRAQALRMRVGDLSARVLGSAPQAVAAYRAVLEADGRNVAARAALAELYGREPATLQQAVDEHRKLLQLEPGRVDSLHALFRLWLGMRQLDRAFCVAGALHFLRAADEAEQAFYTEQRARAAAEPVTPLSLGDVDVLLHHPSARGPLLEVLRAIGDQVGKLHPPQLEAAGVDRRADRLKQDHAVYKAIQQVAALFGVEEFDVYQARRGLMFLETTEPTGVCVGQDVVRKYNAREQRFLIGRAVLGLLDRMAVLGKLSSAETGDLLGGAVRIHHPEYAGLGRRNEELSKSLRRAASRKALKQLEAPAAEVAGAGPAKLDAFLEGLARTADRAGLLVCGDVQVGLTTVLRDDPALNGTRVDSPELFARALRERPDLQALLTFALSDEFFRLRQKVGLAGV